MKIIWSLLAIIITAFLGLQQAQAAPISCDLARTQAMSVKDVLDLTRLVCANPSQDPDEHVDDIAMETHLTADKNLVYQYSKNCYRPINAVLYSPVNADRKAVLLTQQLDRALCDFTEYDGITYRGLNLNPETLEKYMKATDITPPAFTSTSKKLHIACGFTENTLLKIRSKHGREIENLSNHWDEAEVLFRLNTKFKIISATHGFRAKIDSGCKKAAYYIELEEID